MRFNKAKFKVMQLGQDNPQHWHRLGMNRSEQPCEKDLRVLVPSHGHSQPGKPNVSWLHPKQRGQQGREGILPLCSALVRPSWNPAPSSGVPAQEGQGPAGVTPEEGQEYDQRDGEPLL